jgi:hypothetical protein
MESVYSQRIRAGKRRTYFFDIRETRGSDYYLTITESRKKFNEDGYDRHKIFLYKEDFNKFLKGITDAIDYVKTDLMPDYDFDSFNHENPDGSYEGNNYEKPEKPSETESTETNEVVADAKPTQEEEKEIPSTPAPEEKTEEDNSSDNNLHDVEVDKW